MVTISNPHGMDFDGEGNGFDSNDDSDSTDTYDLGNGDSSTIHSLTLEVIDGNNPTTETTEEASYSYDFSYDLDLDEKDQGPVDLGDFALDKPVVKPSSSNGESYGFKARLACGGGISPMSRGYGATSLQK